MKSNCLSVRSPRLSLWLASLTAAGLLPLGGAHLAAQTAYTWNGGTGSWSDNSKWDNGTPNDAGADVFIDGGKTAVVSVVNLAGSYTVGRLTLDAGDTLNVNGDQSFTVTAGGFSGSGSLVNNGTVNVSSPGGGHYTFLRFAGPGTLAGTGTVNLSGSQTILTTNNYNDRITVGAGQTIAGQGNIGNGQSSLTNNGLTTANLNGAALILNPTNNGTGDFTNAGGGAVRAENGGILELAGGGTFNAGTFTALTGSTVQVDNNVTVNNATLASSGTGQVAFGRASYTLGNVTVAAASTVNVSNGSDVTLTGTLTNNGTINVSSPGDGHYAYLRLGGPTTLAGTGTVNLSGSQTILTANNAGDRLTIGAGQAIAGQGNVGDGRTTFTNNGVVGANLGGGTLTIQPGGGTADFINNGFLIASNGGTLALSNASGGTFTNNEFFEAVAGSALNVSAGALTNFSGNTLTGGGYYVSAASAANPATLSFGGGSIVTNNAAVTLDGPGAVFNEFNALANNASGGDITLSSGHNFTTAGALTNAGSFLVSASALTVSGGLNNSGQMLAAQGGAVTVQGNVTNSGEFRVLDGSTLTVQGTLTSPGTLQAGFGAAGGTITATGALTQTASGALSGSGSVTAPTLSLAGSVRPGDNFLGQFVPAVGTLTLNGQVGLLGSTTLVFDLATTAASDQIRVNGALTLDGTLNVNALAGFSAGRYDLLDYTGTLTNNGLDLGTLPTGYSYALDLGTAGQVDLVVTSVVPEPSTWAAVLAGAGFLVLTLRRRAVLRA